MSLFEVLNFADIEKWDHNTDVVVVGFGSAGGCAAIEAVRAGAKVLILERASGGGGTTALAAGHFYLGGGTRVQKACGIDDTVEDMFNYLMAVTPDPDEAKIRLYCNESVEHFNWLVEHGVLFNDSMYKSKHVVQPTDECLIWSGNEKVWPYIEKAKPAPRGHKVAKEGEQGGGFLMERLIEYVKKAEIPVEYNAGACALIVDADKRIVGVQYKQFGEFKQVLAKKGVILAAGGFAMNDAMLKEYCPQLATRATYKQGNPFDDGSGIQLGLAVGGQAIHMDGCLLTSPIYPPENLLKGVLINAEGKRFVTEDSYHAKTTLAMAQQPGGTVYLIVDNEIFARPQLMGQKLIDAAESYEELEGILKLPTGSLVATMKSYNEHAANGEDPEFHKYHDWLKPLDQGPFGAFECSYGKAPYVGFTLGGLKTSIDAEVLDHNDQPIPGLYAAGACASNIAQDGIGYSSGTCIGEGTFFGRRAGRFAAQNS